MTNRELQALRTREIVYRCALEVIRENGFENTSIKSITSAAGVSIGTFYTYFPSKESIILYTYEENEIFYHDSYTKVANMPFPDSLLAFFKLSYTSIESRGLEIMRAIIKLIFTDEFKAKSTDTNRALYSSLTSIIKNAIERGQLSADSNISAWIENIFSTLTGTEVTWCINAGDKKLSDMIEDSIKNLLYGLLPCD